MLCVLALLVPEVESTQHTQTSDNIQIHFQENVDDSFMLAGKATEKASPLVSLLFSMRGFLESTDIV